MLLSVIVPVYNAERYLSECLDSVCGQTSTDFEVLLVDDCSTDSSAKICSSYCDIDKRLRYIRRDRNGGTSAARNTGLANAKGLYITFLDNDDWWSSDKAIETLIRHIEGCNYPDLVCYGAGNFWSGSNTLEGPSTSLEKDLETLGSFSSKMELLIRNGSYASAVWSKTVKRELLESHRILFPEGRRNEDTYVSLQLLYYAQSVTWLDEWFYVWRRNSTVSQSSKGITKAILQDIAWIVEEHVELANNHVFDEDRLDICNNFISYIYLLCLSYYPLVLRQTNRGDRDIQRIHSQLRSWRWLLDFDWNPRVHVTRAVCKVLGLSATMRLLALAMSREISQVRSS